MSKKGDTAWIKCRAREKCEGNTAKVVSHKKREGGGHKTVYRCHSCNHLFILWV